MSDRNEYIICAAIHYDDGSQYLYQPKNISSGYVVCGRRHHNCINIHTLLAKKATLIKDIQGFLTSHDRFVTRQEAAIIAYEADQIDVKLNKLTSEDIY